MLYNKNKVNRLNLRLSDTDYNFLIDLAMFYDVSISDVVRIIVSNYRREVDKQIERGVEYGNNQSNI